jgi:hypothetical protein
MSGNASNVFEHLVSIPEFQDVLAEVVTTNDIHNLALTSKAIFNMLTSPRKLFDRLRSQTTCGHEDAIGKCSGCEGKMCVVSIPYPIVVLFLLVDSSMLFV